MSKFMRNNIQVPTCTLKLRIEELAVEATKNTSPCSKRDLTTKRAIEEPACPTFLAVSKSTKNIAERAKDYLYGKNAD